MNDFHTLTSHMLEEVADFFESSWPEADVDFFEDTVIVNIHDNQYVINKHSVTSQIWLSSPFTGAHHFHYTDGLWVCTRTGIHLQDLLISERDAYAS